MTGNLYLCSRRIYSPFEDLTQLTHSVYYYIYVFEALEFLLKWKGNISVFISGLVENTVDSAVEKKKSPLRLKHSIQEISFTIIYNSNNKNQHTKLSIPGTQGQYAAIMIWCISHFMLWKIIKQKVLTRYIEVSHCKINIDCRGYKRCCKEVDKCSFDLGACDPRC